VAFALPAIDAAIGLAHLAHVVVLSKWFHCRRAMMTLKRQLRPGVRYYPHGYEPAGIPRAGWYHIPKARDTVLGNYERIARYLAADHLAEVERDGDAYV